MLSAVSAALSRTVMGSRLFSLSLSLSRKLVQADSEPAHFLSPCAIPQALGPSV